MNLYQHAKKSVKSICSFLRYSQFQSPETRLVKTIFDHAQPKNFQSTFIFLNLYQHAKNETISLICFDEILDLKILQSDWLRVFWPIFQEQDFSQI